MCVLESGYGFVVTSARSSILIAQMSDCYLSAISLACVNFFMCHSSLCLRFTEIEVFFHPNHGFMLPHKSKHNVKAFAKYTGKKKRRAKLGPIFFLIIPFFLFKAAFRHESLSRTLTLINIYSFSLFCCFEWCTNTALLPLIHLVRSQLQAQNIIHKFCSMERRREKSKTNRRHKSNEIERERVSERDVYVFVYRKGRIV